MGGDGGLFSSVQLLQVQKMEALGHLAGGVAHDLNNQLTVIMGYADLCLHKASDNDRLYQALNQIKRAAGSAARLTRQLLQFGRREPEKFAPVDLDHRMQQFQEMLSHLIREDIQLRMELAGNLWLIEADSGMIDQLVTNLVLNACDAMPEGGILTISTENIETNAAEGQIDQCLRWVRLAISDTGIGMDQVLQKRIFEPFFTTKESEKGTGLGLAVAKDIVQAHRGRIQVKSRPGFGTRFEVFFPALHMDQVESKQENRRDLEQGLEGRGESILFVEDEKELADLSLSILEEAGYRVNCCRTIEQALALCRPGSCFDLLVCDMVLPDGRGTQLACSLQESQPGLKVLLISGYSQEGWTGAPRDMLFPFMAKPFSAMDLKLKVWSVINCGNDREAV